MRMRLLISPLCRISNSEWSAYTPHGNICRHQRESDMLDLIYLGLGVILLAMMGIYARACGRL